MSEAIETFYYVDKYTDEVSPAHDLEGWAKWLSGESEPGYLAPDDVSDGDVFEMSILEVLADIEIKHGKPNEEEPPPEADFFAVRFGPGLGWDAESVCGSFADAVTQARDLMGDEDDSNIIACARFKDGFKATFRKGPPPELVDFRSGKDN